MTAAAEMPADIVEAADDLFHELRDLQGESSARKLILIQEALLAARQRDQWQPIETAPRDGTDILVADDGRQGVEMVSWKGGAKKGGWHTEDRRASYTADFFTHWQPLPAAPKGGAE